MSILFFDTSALVKRYYEEPGTTHVDRLIEGEDTVAISSLSIIETVSAFRRKHNQEKITEAKMNQLLGKFFDEALTDFVMLPMDEALMQHSIDLVLENDLRTLDSLQLSTALSLPEENDVVFISADKELVSTAEQRGITTINPLD